MGTGREGKSGANNESQNRNRQPDLCSRRGFLSMSPAKLISAAKASRSDYRRRRHSSGRACSGEVSTRHCGGLGAPFSLRRRCKWRANSKWLAVRRGCLRYARGN
uniref:Uncharacterized protein n=1 Tax=Rhizophora mucronata TaxID=61149 RepID=A0A2P2N2A3_RHIMU